MILYHDDSVVVYDSVIYSDFSDDVWFDSTRPFPLKTVVVVVDRAVVVDSVLLLLLMLPPPPLVVFALLPLVVLADLLFVIFSSSCCYPCGWKAGSEFSESNP